MSLARVEDILYNEISQKYLVKGGKIMKKKQMPLAVWIFTGLVVGIAAGLILAGEVVKDLVK